MSISDPYTNKPVQSDDFLTKTNKKIKKDLFKIIFMSICQYNNH